MEVKLSVLIQNLYKKIPNLSWKVQSKHGQMGHHNLFLDWMALHDKDVIYLEVNKLNATSESDGFLLQAWQFDSHVHIENKHARISRKTWKKGHGEIAFSDIHSNEIVWC